MTPSLRPLLLALAATAFAGACALPYTPRPAEVSGPGELRLALYAPMVGVAPAKVTFDRDVDGVLESRRANAAAPMNPGLSTIILRAFSLEGHAAIGVGHDCEVGAILGPARLGGEARCRFVDELKDAPLSGAFGLSGGYAPMLDRNGVWGRVGVDLSRRYGSFAPSLNPALSWAPETHVAQLGLPRAYTSSNNPNIEASGRLVRRDLRFVPALGLTWYPRRVERITLQGGVQHSDTGLRVHAGIVPWVVLQSDAPRSLRCSQCIDVEVRDVDVTWGTLLVLGLSTAPRRLGR